MAQEFQQSSFFDTKTYGMSYYSAQIALERFISAKVLRGDLSRILFTSDSFVFRARMEQQDRSLTYSGASSLDFPFANYWYEGFWKDDDRTASKQASQQLSGMDLGSGTYIRSRAVMATIPFTFYFNSDNEARIAYENLQWSFRPRSVVIQTTVKYKSTDIIIPLNVTLESVEFNPDYTEKEWLTQNRIIPIRASFSVRTYALGPNIQTPVTNGIAQGFSEDGLQYITETVLFGFLQSKNLLATPGEYEMSITAYFDPAYDVTVNSITSSALTFDSVTINWDLSIPTTADTTSLSSISIFVPGRNEIVVDSPALVGSHVITNLNELSTYAITILVKLKSGKIKSQVITITTANNPATPDSGGLIGLKSLKGVTF